MRCSNRGQLLCPTGNREVIAAAGWRTPDLLDGVLEIPVRPYRTQCVVLEPSMPLDDFPMDWVPGRHVYFRPEHNGDLLVGSWSFAEDDPESASTNEDEAFRDHVADLVRSFLRDSTPRGSSTAGPGWMARRPIRDRSSTVRGTRPRGWS